MPRKPPLYTDCASTESVNLPICGNDIHCPSGQCWPRSDATLHVKPPHFGTTVSGKAANSSIRRGDNNAPPSQHRAIMRGHGLLAARVVAGEKAKGSCPDGFAAARVKADKAAFVADHKNRSANNQRCPHFAFCRIPQPFAGARRNRRHPPGRCARVNGASRIRAVTRLCSPPL